MSIMTHQYCMICRCLRRGRHHRWWRRRSSHTGGTRIGIWTFTLCSQAILLLMLTSRDRRLPLKIAVKISNVSVRKLTWVCRSIPRQILIGTDKWSEAFNRVTFASNRISTPYQTLPDRCGLHADRQGPTKPYIHVVCWFPNWEVSLCLPDQPEIILALGRCRHQSWQLEFDTHWAEIVTCVPLDWLYTVSGGLDGTVQVN